MPGWKIIATVEFIWSLVYYGYRAKIKGKAITVREDQHLCKMFTSHDSAWKDVIEDLFEDFLEFFFPDIHQDIDFSETPQFLNKELNSIKPYNKTGRRHLDELVKVRLKNGRSACLCIFVHIEVQDRKEKDGVLGERMYVYNYRIVDKYRRKGVNVVSLAVLTDEDKEYRPNRHLVRQWGFELKMTFPIVKLIDFRDNEQLVEKLKTSLNPMAMVVKAQLSSYNIKRADDKMRAVAKLDLIRQCLNRGYNRERITALLKFIDWLIMLPDVLNEHIKDELEEDRTMPYVTSWERIAEKRGVKIGEERGVKIGEERGVKIGEERGARGEKIKTARKMLADGMNLQIISKYTGLTIDEINNLIETGNDN